MEETQQKLLFPVASPTERLLNTTIGRERRLEEIKAMESGMRSSRDRAEIASRRSAVVEASIEAAEARISELEKTIQTHWRQAREAEEQVAKDSEKAMHLRLEASNKENEIQSLDTKTAALLYIESKARQAEAVSRENAARLEERIAGLREKLEEARIIINSSRTEPKIVTCKYEDDLVAETTAHRLADENVQLETQIEDANQIYRQSRRRIVKAKRKTQKLQLRADAIVTAATTTVREMRRTFSDEKRDAAIRAAHQRIDQITVTSLPTLNKSQQRSRPRTPLTHNHHDQPADQAALQRYYQSRYITLSLREAAADILEDEEEADLDDRSQYEDTVLFT